MPKLTDTQTIILSAAAQRADNLAMPLPKGLHGVAAKKVVTMMIESGWLDEVDATLCKGEPLWRETGDGHGTTLIITDAGLLAIGVEPVVASTMTNLRKAKLDPAPTPQSTDAPKPVAIRSGTKQAQIIALIKRPEGASITEIVEVTGWAPHSARRVISGALKKKLGLAINSTKEQGRGTVHRIA